jgi:hypothetical protein
MRTIDSCRILSIEMFEAGQFVNTEKLAFARPQAITLENAAPGSFR